MGIEEPESMENLMYVTNRRLGDGKIMAWTYRVDCPECDEEYLTKPSKKTGKGPNTRAKKYTCDNCGFEMPEEDVRDAAVLQAKYTCPHCGEKGTAETDYKREKYKGTKAYIFTCEHCDEEIPLTKKMKEVDL